MEGSIVKLSKVPWTAATPRDKVRTVAELGAITEQLRHSGKKVVHAHGTFDLLHVGHVRHLEAARELGDILVVTLTADRFVNKGPGRPVFGEALRAEMLAICNMWIGSASTIHPTL
jgi:cytidyltransferase-like protein